MVVDGTYFQGKRYLTAFQIENEYKIGYETLRYHREKGRIKSYELSGHGTTKYYLHEDVLKLISKDYKKVKKD